MNSVMLRETVGIFVICALVMLVEAPVFSAANLEALPLMTISDSCVASSESHTADDTLYNF